jgi:hypothetical protein
LPDLIHGWRAAYNPKLFIAANSKLAGIATIEVNADSFENAGAANYRD